jgi:hypothetical protein
MDIVYRMIRMIAKPSQNHIMGVVVGSIINENMPDEILRIALSVDGVEAAYRHLPRIPFAGYNIKWQELPRYHNEEAGSLSFCTARQVKG